MTYPVRFHTEAEAEMNEVEDYLNRESTGLGEVFLDDLRHAMLSLLQPRNCESVILSAASQSLGSAAEFAVGRTQIGARSGINI
jgi:hypothetical protein